MATGFPYFVTGGPSVGEDLRRNRVWFLLLGALLVFAGTLAIGFPVAATLVTVELFGFILLVAGSAEIVSCFWARRVGSAVLRVLGGMLYLFVGVVMVERPGLGAAGYTLILAMFFIAAGAVRIALAVGSRFAGWGWVLAGGVVSVLLGLMIWREFPAAALWVIGTFVGIDLIFNGVSWLMLGLAAGSLPAAEPAPPGRVPVPGGV
jgi:uncharacterized membrane protein HdeD (DUF308 family)